MVLVYQAIHDALLPLRLHNLPKVIDVFVEDIERRNEKKRPKQTELFRAELRPLPSEPAHEAHAPMPREAA